MSYVYGFLGLIMDWCYGLCNNYGIAIILFTLITKIVLLPLSVWMHLNSIKMIKIQPDINYLKARYYGQGDVIAEEQAKLFKKEGYHPLASTIPTIVQLILLMGVVGVIRLGIGSGNIDMSFGPVDLGATPALEGIRLIWVPVVAALSAWVLCIAQNASNVLQSEQSKWNKHGMTIFSVALSLFLGWYVFVGTAFYWVCSNLMAVLQLYILNWCIKPSKYIDYDKLEDSRKKLAELQGIGKKEREGFFSETRKKERADYKKFFSVGNKHLVFYSESNGFYKYFKGFIEYILANTKVTVHYITSDPKDKIFEMEKENPRIRGYYIGENRLITLMMKMDADVVVMTMPDLENFHIKRSLVRKDIEYIFVQHGMGSNNLTMRRGCTDHFDTVFCAGVHQKREEQEIEKVYGVKQRNLVEVGYPLIDDMLAAYASSEHKENPRKKILIAPSWQTDNIIDNCLEQLLDELKGRDYDIIVRPHPQEVRHKKEYMDALKEKYEPQGIEIQTDFSSNNPVLEADLLITDWSDISCEFAFVTLRPVLFINTPMKIRNPEWEKLSETPINILVRDNIGRNLDTDKLQQTAETVEYMLGHAGEFRKQIEDFRNEYLYNIGTSSEAGGKYIIKAMQRKIEERRNKGENR